MRVNVPEPAVCWGCPVGSIICPICADTGLIPVPLSEFFEKVPHVMGRIAMTLYWRQDNTGRQWKGVLR